MNGEMQQVKDKLALVQVWPVSNELYLIGKYQTLSDLLCIFTTKYWLQQLEKCLFHRKLLCLFKE